MPRSFDTNYDNKGVPSPLLCRMYNNRTLSWEQRVSDVQEKIWPDRKTYEDLQSVASEKFAAQTNMDALRSSIEEGIKAQEVNRRKRVQGSYECERRKKRREEEGSTNGNDDVGDNGSNSPTDEDGGDTSSSTYSSSGASSLVSSTPSSALTISDCSDDPPPSAALVNSGPTGATGIQSLTPPMLRSGDDIGISTNPNVSMSELPTLTSGSQHNSSAHGVQPPATVLHPKERLNQWLDENPSSPHMPEENMTDPLQRRTDDADMYDPPVSGADEIEAELLPSAALLRRQCPEELRSPRYIRTKHDTTMEHLAEYIHVRVMEEVQSNQSDFDADPVPTVPRPQHFYVFSRNDGHHIRKIFLHETMLTAQSAMTRDDHLTIFFDTEPPQLREEKSSVLEDVVYAHFLSLPHL
ncbi:hypothetical protein OESDEN_05655 [Oesophagostomum dentatum]|uniref:RING-type E3 ubiquitin transferase n=1 Tax=Oesophagostomum dentatum TaxID=61180 RepID=A0A0B1TE64_OESDE|nr:hypothetical protein OESDEN_05655 [Oesophagostomum dentatum]